ncbi:CRISPR-associated protein Cas5h [Thermosyntropha lipolytica DSM 11003]|uniref:CRISPR-associated protein Cas5h n=1 Tax=Thermosyntropha lipolytica DSM 11003 TaxID=1123382 RepID=A0A1M5KAR7_9FIRM|nr:CRISPR-associated protein Cas5 [Thermosyntropha lipolytica]SHG49828.1 CRISPR-associated protein Cas5h [Thermosyntropha lipolytica DSM 11003]
MRVIIFDLKGPMAHFRKIYTNSSSLSYSIPPRTTLAGIIAAVLGWERDSYYEKMHSEMVGLAVRKINPTRKIMQTLNYIKATSPSHLANFSEGHSQIPFEIICGEPEVRYRVYFRTEDEEVYEKTKNALKSGRSVFPIYLGAAPFSGVWEWIGEGELEKDVSQEVKDIFTPIDVNLIAKIVWQEMQKDSMLVKDRMPVDFTQERYPLNTKSYLYDDKGGSIKLKLKEEALCFKVSYKDKEQETCEHILFY